MSGAWINTNSGRQFFPLTPKAEDIDINDVARALSHMCRFAGHVERFYCVTPDTKILTDDLNWIEAAGLKVGDGLVSFQEEPARRSDQKRTRRRLEHARVLHYGIIIRPIYKIELDSGRVLRASAEHPWLVCTREAGNQAWRSCEQLHEDFKNGRVRYMPRFLDTWTRADGYEAGYLSGLFDGEGHVSCRSGFELGISQKDGQTWERACALMDHFHVPFRTGNAGDEAMVRQAIIKGEWFDRFSVLGRIRPERLITNTMSALKSGWSVDACAVERDMITNVTFEGDGEVVALETSSRTYFANGYGAHNSVGEHSVHVSRAIEAMGGSLNDVRWGLLHDASEAYLVDIPRPLKITDGFAPYREAEKRLQAAVAVRFGLSVKEPEVVTQVDRSMVAIEADALFVRRNAAWQAPYCEPRLKELVKISAWAPDRARREFLDRYKELFDSTISQRWVCQPCGMCGLKVERYCTRCGSSDVEVFDADR